MAPDKKFTGDSKSKFNLVMTASKKAEQNLVTHNKAYPRVWCPQAWIRWKKIHVQLSQELKEAQNSLDSKSEHSIEDMLELFSSEDLEASVAKSEQDSDNFLEQIIDHFTESDQEEGLDQQANINTITATMSSMVASLKYGKISNTNGKLAQKYPLPEHLDTVTINLSFMQPGSKPFSMQILPDTGANVTAIDVSKAKGIALEKTSVVLRVANGTVLNTLGTAECRISRHGNTANELVYIVKGLAEPLLSRRMLKALNMLHPEWPHQSCSRAAANNVASKPESSHESQAGHANTWDRRRPENSYADQGHKS